MSANTLLNPLYEKVRELGFPYQIQETVGSVIIKVNSNTQYQKFHHPREKFRFHTTRSLNGSDIPNWRTPQIYNEKSHVFDPAFPDTNFLRKTPAPQSRTLPPPSLSAPTPPTPTSVSLPPPRYRTSPPPKPILDKTLPTTVLLGSPNDSNNTLESSSSSPLEYSQQAHLQIHSDAQDAK